MSRESELGVAIWRLRDHAKLKDQQLAAADLLERFYDDVTLSMIARILRGERQKNELSERDQNIWMHVKMRMSDGLNYFEREPLNNDEKEYDQSQQLIWGGHLQSSDCPESSVLGCRK